MLFEMCSDAQLEIIALRDAPHLAQDARSAQRFEEWLVKWIHVDATTVLKPQVHS